MVVVYIKLRFILVCALIAALLCSTVSAADENRPYAVVTHINTLEFASKPVINSYQYMFGDTQCTLHEYNLTTDYGTADGTMQSHQMLALLTFPDELSQTLEMLGYDTQESFARLAMDLLEEMGFEVYGSEPAALHGNATIAFAGMRGDQSYIGWLGLNSQQAVALASTYDDIGSAFLNSVYTNWDEALVLSDQRISLMNASAEFTFAPTHADSTVSFLYTPGVADAYISVQAPALELARAVQIPDYMLLTATDSEEWEYALLAQMLPADAQAKEYTELGGAPAMRCTYTLNGTPMQAILILQDGFALELAATLDPIGEAFIATATVIDG